MMNGVDKMDKEKLNKDSVRLSKLRDSLVEKINAEWAHKWRSQHGLDFDGFDKVPSLNAFLEDLLIDIERTIKAKIGLKATAEILVSKDSLRRFVQSDQIGALKFKTRHTLAYYLGYEGWDDFVEKNVIHEENLIEFFEKNKSTEEEGDLLVEEDVPTETAYSSVIPKEDILLDKINKSPKILILGLSGMFCLFGCYWILNYFFFKEKDLNEVQFNLTYKTELNFPTAQRLDYDFSGLDLNEVVIKHHVEPLDWYLHQDTSYHRVDKEKGGLLVLHCDKPGLHYAKLYYKGKLVRNLTFPIRSKNWYAIAYAKERKNQNNFFYTNQNDWRKLREGMKNSKKMYVPRGFLDESVVDSRYRADFFYSGDIHVNMNELFLEVDLDVVSELESFDCKYFQIGIIDSKGNYNYLYVPISTCSLESELEIAKVGFLQESSIPYTKRDALSIDTSFPKHNAKIYFKNKIVTIEIDGKKRFETAYESDLGTAEVFNISVNGETAIEHFKVASTKTNKVLYEEVFK